MKVKIYIYIYICLLQMYIYIYMYLYMCNEIFIVAKHLMLQSKKNKSLLYAEKKKRNPKS